MKPRKVKGRCIQPCLFAASYWDMSEASLTYWVADKGGHLEGKGWSWAGTTVQNSVLHSCITASCPLHNLKEMLSYGT